MTTDKHRIQNAPSNHSYLKMVSVDVNPSDGPRRLAVEGCGIFFRYGSKKDSPILNGVDINVEKGAIYGLLGPSGCGKTTLLRSVLGRLKPSNGVIKVFGREPGEDGFCIPGRGVGYMPQELALAPDMTIEEILMYFGRLYLMDRQHILDRIAFLLNFLEIPKRKRFIKNLSGGQKRRVSFAAAFIHEPPLLILDEPTVGVDPLLRHSIWKHLKELAVKNNMTIIITTHYVEEARQAHMVGLMRGGHLLAEMNPESLIRKHGVQNLEDVFCKLCRKETSLKQQENPENDHYGIPLTATCNGAVKDKIWLPREEIKATDTEAIFNNVAEECVTNGNLLLHDEQDSDMKKIYHRPSSFTKLKNSLKRMSTLIAKSFICLMRNKVFFFIQVFLPVLEVLMFYICVGHQPYDLPIAIVNDEAGRFGYSEIFIDSLDNHTFRKEIHTNLSTAIESIENGESWAALHIGQRFSMSAMDRLLEGNNVENSTIEDSTIKLHIDMTNQQIAITILYSILRSFESFAKDMLVAVHENPRLSNSPIFVEKPVYGEMKANFTEFMAPGIILGIIYITAVGLTSLSIIIERKEGLLDRSWVAGVGAVEVIFAIVFTLFVTMLCQIFLVVILSFYVISLPSQGSILLLALCILLAGTSGMGNGLLISALCPDEVTAMVFAIGTFYPVLILSGILWPIEGMHYILRHLSSSLPLTLLSKSMRSVMSRGWSFTDHYTWVGFAIPAVWTVIFLFASIVIFKLRKW